MIDYSKLQSSLKRLGEQNWNYRQGNPVLSDLDREGIAARLVLFLRGGLADLKLVADGLFSSVSCMPEV